jgi:hypothetical protein
MKNYPLHQNQFAYQTGKSIQTALYNMVTHNDSTAEHKEISLGAFLDTEGASDRTSSEVIRQAAERYRDKSTIPR